MYIGNVFNYKVNFPLDNEIVIIIGENGSYKTKTIECLNDFLLKNNEDVFFIDEYRSRNYDFSNLEKMNERIKNISMYLVLNGEYKKYNHLIERIEYAIEKIKKGSCLSDGEFELVRIFSCLNTEKDIKNLTIILDQPEIHLHLSIKKHLIEFLNEFGFKRIVAVTHCPSIIGGLFKHIVSIKDIIDYKNN